MADHIHILEDSETDLTPRDITDLPLEEQVEFITGWFHTLFEDPQNEAPYAIDKESPYNYEYIWGGPYDARDEIGDNFVGLASEEAMAAALHEVEKDGTIEWAPTSNHPDRRIIEEEAMAEEVNSAAPSLDDIRHRLTSGGQPHFGDRLEIRERETARLEIARLRELLEQGKRKHGGIGHNNPPEQMTLPTEMAVNISVAINVIDVELTKPAPNVVAVIESAGKLEKVLAWVWRKLDKSVDGFMTAIGVGIAADLAGLPVFEKIAQLFSAVLEWLNTVTLPF